MKKRTLKITLLSFAALAVIVAIVQLFPAVTEAIIQFPTSGERTQSEPAYDPSDPATKAKFDAWLATCDTSTCNSYRETHFLQQAFADGKISRAAFHGALLASMLWSPLGALVLVALIFAAGIEWYERRQKRQPKRPDPADEPLLISTPYGILEIVENKTGSMALVVDADEDPPGIKPTDNPDHLEGSS